jgi:hypothetical protein
MPAQVLTGMSPFQHHHNPLICALQWRYIFYIGAFVSSISVCKVPDVGPTVRWVLHCVSCGSTSFHFAARLRSRWVLPPAWLRVNTRIQTQTNSRVANRYVAFFNRTFLILMARVRSLYTAHTAEGLCGVSLCFR